MKKRMNKKGAMELSMNTIVIVVIGITLLVLGLVFVRGIFTKLGGLGTEAFQQAEQELKQIQAGDTKINFPASIDVKKGKSSNPTLRICNTDGVLEEDDVYLIVEGNEIYEGLIINIGGTIVSRATPKPTAKNIGKVDYQYCTPIPVLVNSQPGTVVDPTEQPFLILTVRKGDPIKGLIYDSIGTIINIT